ncbi:MAG: hypothetical protein AB4058_10245 [Microcystaceae cyanobacterium]
MIQYDQLKQSYQEQLIKAGVSPQRAAKAASVLTLEELELIAEIWLDWGCFFSQAEVSIS